MSQRESPKGFKVTDRRSFTADGERRSDSEQLETDEQTSEKVDSDNAENTIRAGIDGERTASAENRSGPGPAVEREPSADVSPESTGGVDAPAFMDLLGLLATQTSLALGEPHPVTGESHEDIHAARATISMLEALSDKTKGNLSNAESDTLQAILYQLRMQYVAKAKGGG